MIAPRSSHAWWRSAAAERLRASRLSPDERADLESALQSLDSRVFEDRRLISLLLVCVAAWLMLAEVLLIDEVRDSYREEGGPLRFFEGFFTALPHSLPFLIEPDVLLFGACVALPFVIVALVVYAWHQDEQVHALTSFGLVRKRRKALRLLRYAHVVETRIGKGWSLARFESTDKLEVFARDGTSLVVHGYRESLAEWKSRIDARRRATDTDGKRA